jgi:riboflavin-specific deaminase-like protein
MKEVTNIRIIINCAITLDGKLTAGRKISDDTDLERVYRLRAQADGILVGANTIIKDNPTLTARGIGRDPKPIILDKHAIIPLDAAILKRAPLIVTSKSRRIKGEIITDDFSWDNILNVLSKNCFGTILVEGGGKVIRSLVNEKKWDEFYIYYAPVFGGNEEVPLVNGPLEKNCDARIEFIKKQGEGFLVKLLPR